MMNDNEYQLNGQQVRITMPAPDDQLYTQLVVIHYLKDGSIEYITPIYNADGTLSFRTTSFSPVQCGRSEDCRKPALVGNTDKAYTNKNTTTSGSTTTKLTPNVSAGNTGSSSNGSTSGSVTKKNTQKSQTQQAYGTTLKRVNLKTGDYQQTAWYAGTRGSSTCSTWYRRQENRKKEI